MVAARHPYKSLVW